MIILYFDGYEFDATRSNKAAWQKWLEHLSILLRTQSSLHTGNQIYKEHIRENNSWLLLIAEFIKTAFSLF